MDPVEIEYLSWAPEGSAVTVRINPGVVEGIAHDVVRAAEIEVGGLLLGRVTSGPRPEVRVERYQRILCAHLSGPGFILGSAEISALEAAAGSILAAGEFSVVGLYRSHTRPGFQLEEPDLGLIRRYFNDSTDLILLLRKTDQHGLSARFHSWDGVDRTRPMGGEFPFRISGGKAQGMDVAPELRTMAETPPKPLQEPPRRLVPDFLPAAVEPAPSVFGLSGPAQFANPDELTSEHQAGENLRKWLPVVAAFLVVGGVLWFFVHSGSHMMAPASAITNTAGAVRPLGLYVDSSGGPVWRLSWNPNATALRDARNVRLFVHERNGESGDDNAAGDQNPIDLLPRDVAAGSYQYRPIGNDVTFRLEVTDQAGHVSAESFRLVRTTPAPAAAKPLAESEPAQAVPHARLVQPHATYRAPAVVAAGVRSRIRGAIPIDVRVEIDARGRVTSAKPIGRQHTDVEQYLAARAVQAAKQWRFEPARENGRAVDGTQILHFVFEK